MALERFTHLPTDKKQAAINIVVSGKWEKQSVKKMNRISNALVIKRFY